MIILKNIIRKLQQFNCVQFILSFSLLLAFHIIFWTNAFPQRSFTSNEFDNSLTFDFLPIFYHLMWLVELHST